MHFKAFLRLYTVTLNLPLTCQHTAEIQLQFTLHMLFFGFLCSTLWYKNTQIFCFKFIVLWGFVLQHSVYNFLQLHETIYFQNYAHCSSIKWKTAYEVKNSFWFYYPVPAAEYFIKDFVKISLDIEMLHYIYRAKGTYLLLPQHMSLSVTYA